MGINVCMPTAPSGVPAGQGNGHHAPAWPLALRAWRSAAARCASRLVHAPALLSLHAHDGTGCRCVPQVKTEGGKIIRVEAHPIPEHPRPRRCKGRVALVGDAAGYVTKCSGEGIYFAAKSGRMAAEAIVQFSEGGKKMVGEAALRDYLDKWDRKYWTTYKVLDILQKVFYRSNPAREAFVELCEDNYVQKMTFDSYLYKTVVPGNPIDDVKLLVRTVGSMLRANALRSGKGAEVSFGSKTNEEKLVYGKTA